MSSWVSKITIIINISKYPHVYMCISIRVYASNQACICGCGHKAQQIGGHKSQQIGGQIHKNYFKIHKSLLINS